MHTVSSEVPLVKTDSFNMILVTSLHHEFQTHSLMYIICTHSISRVSHSYCYSKKKLEFLGLGDWIYKGM